VFVVSELFQEVETALAQAHERLASLATAKESHESATAALTEAAAALTSVAARMDEVVGEQRKLQAQLAEQARQFLDATSEGPDLSVLTRLEARLEEVASRLMTPSPDPELVSRLDALETSINASHEAVLGVAKRANAHVTAKVGSVLESVHSYGDQIYELTAGLYNELVANESVDDVEGDPSENGAGMATSRHILPDDGETKRTRLFGRGSRR
jgi:DNA repair exonuclease SbcCD ATPase subunit